MNNKYFKYPLILFIVAGVCASAITATFMYTNPILIKREEENTKQNLMSLYDNVKDYKLLFGKDKLDDETIQGVYQVNLKDGAIRYVYQTSAIGKNGSIISLIGFDKDKIDKVKNIQHNETPGIGAKIDETKYLDAIVKQPLDNMQVDIISGATYSSSAVKKAVNASIKHYLKEVKK